MQRSKADDSVLVVLIMAMMPLISTYEFMRQPRFTSSNYIECNFTAAKGYEVFSVAIEFKPESLNGMLIYQTNWNRDFFYAMLINGFVEFRFDCGEGNIPMISLNKIKLSEWNTLIVEKDGPNSGYLILNGATPVEGSSNGSCTAVNTLRRESMIVGGFTEHMNIENTTSFVGCVRNLSVNAVDLTIKTESAERLEQEMSLHKLLLMGSIGGIKNTTIDYSFSEDMTLRSKLDSEEIETCYDDVTCQIYGVVKHVSEQLDPVCHWNKKNSPFKLTFSLSSNCSTDHFTTNQQWSFYKLTALYPEISDDNEVEINSVLSEPDVEISYTGSGEPGKLSRGVYGVKLNISVSTTVDIANITVVGYFILTCDALTEIDPDCTATRDLLTELEVSMDLVSSKHCLHDNSYTEGLATTILVDAEKYNTSLYLTTEMTTEMETVKQTTEMTTEMETVKQTTEMTTEMETVKQTTEMTTEMETVKQTTEMTTEMETVKQTTAQPDTSGVVISVICYSNCGKKVTPSAAVKLRSTCRNCSEEYSISYERCKLCTSDTISNYTWRYLVCNNQQCNTTFTSDGPDKTTFELLPDVDSQGKVVVTVTLEGGQVVNAEYSIEVNEAPVLNNCSVSPNLGFGLLTAFNISCDVCIDSDQPLLYSLYRTSPTGKQSLLYQSTTQEMKFLYLVEGEANMNYTYNLSVLCIDDLGLATTNDVQVQVFPPTKFDANIDILDVVKNMITNADDLLPQGRIIELLQLLQMSAMYINMQSVTVQDYTGQIAQIHNNSLNLLTKVNITGLSELEMATNSLNAITATPDVLNQELKVHVTSLYRDLADSLQSQVKSISLPKAKNSIGLILDGMSTVLDFNTVDGNTKIQEMSTKRSQDKDSQLSTIGQVKNSTEGILNGLNVVTDSIQDLMITDTEPVVFRTEQLLLVVAKVSETEMVPPTMSVTTGKDGSYVTEGVTFPDDINFFNKTSLDADEYVGIQMLYMEKNPYIWDESARNVTTSVISLVLKDKNKKPIEVKQLQNDGISINMANRDSYDSSDHRVHLAFTYSNNTAEVTDMRGGCLVLRLNTTDNRDYLIRLRPLGLNIPLIVSLNHTDISDLSYSQILSDGTVLTSESNYTMFLTLGYSLSNGIIVCPSLSDGLMETYFNHSVQTNKCSTESDCSKEFLLSVNISVETYSASCLYWNITEELWSNEGCQVSLPTTTHQIHCRCSHLTAFSGSLFITPNTVDPFTDAELFLTFFENPVVVMAVISIWIIYFLMLGWARKADRKDLTKGGVTVLFENSPYDKHMYLVCIVTAWRQGSGTTAVVSLSLTGSSGYSTRHCLSNSIGHKQCFSSGSEDWFLITSPYDLGHIQYLTVWHDNNGVSPEWLLSRIIIENLHTKKEWTFLYGDWIAVDRGSFSLRIVLESINDEDITIYKKQNFYLKSSHDLRDGHLWMSIICKPSYSSFTRAQRLSCALSLLLLTMLTSLMFHGIPLDDPDDQASIGAISFSLADIVIGIQSGLIMFPISILILQLFMRVGRRPQKRTLKEFDDKHLNELPLNKDLDSKAAINSQLEDYDLEAKRNFKMLPWWTLYIAWILVISSAVVSSYFVMLYGLKYGYQKSVEWIVSFLTAFFQSAFITQPLKVLGVAWLITIVLKKPVQLDGGKADTYQDGLQVKDAPVLSHYVPVPLPKEEISRIRKRVKLEWLTAEKLRDIGLFIIYISVVLFMVHGQRSVELSYQCTNALENIFINPTHDDDHLAFTEVTTPQLFWEYLDRNLLPVLSEMSLFNESTFKISSSFYLVGLYRLRQLRIKPDSCESQTDAVKIMVTAHQTCNGAYWIGNGDSETYNNSWSVIWDKSISFENNEWSYQSQWQLKTVPFSGIHATYGGGGYAAEFNNNHTATGEKISSLKKSDWIDHRTRAICVEFTLYNPNINLFSVVMLLFEFPNIGGIFPYHQIFTTKFFHYTSGLEIFSAVCEVLFLLFTVTFTFIEIQKVRKNSIKVYFKDTWNIIEVLQISLSYAIIGLFFQRLVSVDSVMEEYLRRGSKSFVSFYTAVSWDFILQYLMAALVALVILKTFKILKFNKKMFFLSATLAHGREDLFNFAIMFFLLVSAFAHFSTLVFGPFISSFKSFGASFMTFFIFVTGELNYFELCEASMIWGPILYFSIFFVVNCFLLIMFISIINFAIRDAQGTLSDMENELEVMDYIIEKVFNFFPKYRTKSLNSVL